MNCYLCCCLALILKLVVATSSSSNDILVEISSGTVRGIAKETWTNNTYFGFYGIPYAEPPVGKLRFKAPVEVQPWKGIRNATEDGFSCPQSQQQFLGVPTDEDCLYLNVYTKNLNDSQPVIVWIHPGAFIGLTGSSSWYGPDYLLDHDVVFVSFNYRLNALGFLSTGDESAIGNYGMKDQVAVLKWIQKNIDKFGGDPKKVTLAGDSAGSAAVFLHMLSPMSQGLFHRAIAMSGGIFGNIKWPKSKEQLLGAENLSKIFKCPTKSTSDMIECLKKVPAEKIISKFETSHEIGERNILKFGPVIEPDVGKKVENFLSGDPHTLIKSKTFRSVPLITGFTEYELFRRGMAIAKNSSVLLNLNKNFEKIAPVMLEYDFRDSSDIENITNTLKAFYFGKGDITNTSAESLGEMFSDYRINYGEYATAKLLIQYGDKPVFFYKFSYKGTFGNEYDPINDKTVGPGHMSDIQYILYNSKLFPKFEESDPEAIIVKRMTSMWFNFASIGVPITNESPVQWRPMTEGKYEYIEINRTLKMENGVPFPERMKVWETLFPI